MAEEIVPKIANFKQTAEQWLEEHKEVIGSYSHILDFAAYLDSFKSINSELQILALQKTLETYVEFYQIVKATVDKDTLQICIEQLQKNHKR